jgi:hypothetical protein
MRIDIKKALTYPFKDSNWILKFVIGGLLLMVPVVNFLVVGYMMRLLKDASEGNEPTLPQWGDWENLFKEGFFGALIVIIYSAAIFIVTSILSAIPIIGCIVLPINLIIMFVLPVWLCFALIEYMKTKVFNDAFVSYNKIIEKIKANVKDIALTALIVGAVNMACGFLFCLIFIPVFYAQLVSVKAFGDLYRLEAPAAAAPEAKA